MGHHGGVQPVEPTTVQQPNLAARLQYLLGGCAHHGDGQTSIIRHRGSSQRRAHRRRCDDVVAARVADRGEAVVLGADAHAEWT